MKKSYKKGPRFGPDIHRPIVSQPETVTAPVTKQEKKEDIVVETPKIVEEQKPVIVPTIESAEVQPVVELIADDSTDKNIKPIVVEEKKIEHQKSNDVRRKR